MGVTVGVLVAVGLPRGVSVGVGVMVEVGSGVNVAVGRSVTVAVGVGVEVEVGVGVTVGVLVTVGVVVAVGVGDTTSKANWPAPYEIFDSNCIIPKTKATTAIAPKLMGKIGSDFGFK